MSFISMTLHMHSCTKAKNHRDVCKMGSVHFLINQDNVHGKQKSPLYGAPVMGKDICSHLGQGFLNFKKERGREHLQKYYKEIRNVLFIFCFQVAVIFYLFSLGFWGVADEFSLEFFY